MLFPRLCEFETLRAAWQRVLSHYPTSQVPLALQEFDRKKDALLNRLSHMLANQNFIPEPAAIIQIPKPSKPGEHRAISLVRPEDRIVLTALNNLLEPVFEPQFAAHSFAYRRNRGALDAIKAVENALQRGLTAAACADIDNFFDTIDRKRLLQQVRNSIWEKPILRLLDLYLQMASVAGQEWIEARLGIAQGSPLSPLLANVYLTDFDQYLSTLGGDWVRYADDFILLARDSAEAATALTQSQTFLREKLDLEINPSVQYGTAESGFDFLGFHLEHGRRTISQLKLQSMQSTLAVHFQHNTLASEALANAVFETVEGWKRYYGHGDTANQFAQIEIFLGLQLLHWLKELLLRSNQERVSASDRSALERIPLLVHDRPEDRRAWLNRWIQQAEQEARAVAAPKREHGQRPPISTRQAIERRKREFLERKFELEEIVISQPGLYLGRSGERLVVRDKGEKVAEAPLSTLRNVTFVTTAASLSVDLMSECAERGIGIQVLGHAGRPVVVAGSPEMPAHELSLRQSALAEQPAGLKLARTLISGKIENQMRLLRYFGKYRGRTGAEFGKQAVGAVELMTRIVAELKLITYPESASPEQIDLYRGRLFALEGRAAGHYWNAVRSLVAGHEIFEGRVRKGARDKVNSLLNYGYGILYSRLMPLLLRAGLNPYVGFLHKPQPGKAGLLFDAIEEFRAPVVDRVVFSLLNRKVALPMGVEGLDVASRAVLARAVLRRLQTQTRYHGAQFPMQKIMEMQVKKLVEAIHGELEYEPFAMPW